jgi:hypothetical protein
MIFLLQVDVHARDVVQSMADNDVADEKEFKCRRKYPTR